MRAGGSTAKGNALKGDPHGVICVCGFGGVNFLCEVWRQSMFIEPETLDKLRKDVLSIRN